MDSVEDSDCRDDSTVDEGVASPSEVDEVEASYVVEEVHEVHDDQEEVPYVVAYHNLEVAYQVSYHLVS